MGFFTKSIKGPIVSKVLKVLLEKLISGFGTVSDFSVDSTTKQIVAVLQLRGESLPLTIDILKYEVESVNGESHLIIRELKSSKEWLDIALNKYIASLQIAIPKEYELIIKQSL